MNDHFRNTVSGRRCLVMGLGSFGGGLGVTRSLVAAGAKHIVVTDLAHAEKLAASLQALQPHIQAGRVSLQLGEHREADFRNAEVVIANPAVPQPWKNPLLLAARASGALVTTEIRLALDGLPSSRVIGVTGSAGKSTTSAMITHILNGQGTTATLAGNIGGSLLENPPTLGSKDWLVAELSSAMLWWLGGALSDQPWLPRIGVLTNLADNHIDWHGDANHYSQSKSCIRGAGQSVFLTRFENDDALAARKFAALPAGAWWNNSTLDPTMESQPDLACQCNLPGVHNQRNALLAMQVAAAALRLDGVTPNASELSERLADFRGLPHRLALVHSANDVRWFDDSKATTPEATLLAVASFPDATRIHLIAGGSDKGSDLSGIASLAPHLAGLYAIGTTAPSLLRHGGHHCGTLEMAAQTIVAALKPGDVVLLSPGCASFDQFGNYQERGNRFAALARTR